MFLFPSFHSERGSSSLLMLKFGEFFGPFRNITIQSQEMFSENFMGFSLSAYISPCRGKATKSWIAPEPH